MTKQNKRPAPAPQPAPIPQAAPTRGAISDRIISRIVMMADGDIEVSKQSLDGFAAKLAINPAAALEWSASAFTDAARFTVAHEAKAVLKDWSERADEYMAADGIVMARYLRDRFLERALRETRSPSRSTSVPSNEMARCLAAEQARWVESLDNILGRYEDMLNR